MSTTEEKQLYLCLRPFIGWPKNCWFVVLREPNLLNATTASDSDNQSQGRLRLAAVPPPIDANNNYVSGTAWASVGTKIYLIRCLDSTEGLVHDCSFDQTWERSPSMATALINPVAKVAPRKDLRGGQERHSHRSQLGWSVRPGYWTLGGHS
ncbi:hypothetical protein PanWU01x14_164660 [Parasponia andersonii]|uniref:Uncharacterized protein n=1 Tax=Parasponia andersonii TaxID=3476 RepID=A0A2P5CCE5_PARAD|nr:hypothetical protein PanWU01x14_164660 [Parasponia andersonii]